MALVAVLKCLGSPGREQGSRKRAYFLEEIHLFDEIPQRREAECLCLLEAKKKHPTKKPSRHNEECRKCNKKTGPATQLIWITDTPVSGRSEEPTMIRDTPDLREAVKNIGP